MYHLQHDGYRKNIKLSREELPKEYKELFNGNKDESFNFINLGRLARQKGQWFLIRSFRDVVDHHPHAKLFILGDGVLRSKLEQLITDLELTDNVYLLEEQKNVFPFLKESDCFVLSSLWEGLPLVLIEALTMDLPIISVDCKTGPREVLCPELDLGGRVSYPYLGEHAILTMPLPNQLILSPVKEVPLTEGEEMLSDLMIRMIEDSQLGKNYSNSRVIAENFDKEKIISKWDKLLKKVNLDSGDLYEYWTHHKPHGNNSKFKSLHH